MNILLRSALPTHEVVVPGPLGRNHEEPEEAVREKHLDLLVVGREVAVWVVASVPVVASPLVAGWGQFVGSQ